ncbi:hypothetical protein DPMN_080079 [Dreissena polymorpha]|uniref:Uncharacterized protein n=1 Tax=Dreissena polymorpha TaxID=45954 RepID=A0A9D4BRN4_DREPO|nr:hypothetical protein DPMN_080079 [Dreissena polymorpha]
MRTDGYGSPGDRTRSPGIMIFRSVEGLPKSIYLVTTTHTDSFVSATYYYGPKRRRHG